MDLSEKLIKFEALLKTASSEKKKLADTLLILDRLQEDLRISNNVEKNLRFQLTNAQSRVLFLQKEMCKLKQVEETIKENNNQVQKQNQQIEELSVTVFQLRNIVQEKIDIATKEKELLSTINSLKLQLKEKDDKYYLLHMEQQVAIKEKNTRLYELEEMIAKYKNEIERSKLEYDISKNDHDRIQLMLNQQILGMEEKIKKQEVALRTYENTNPVDVRMLWDKRVNVTWADAARKAAAQSDIKADSNSPSVIQHNEITSDAAEFFDEPLDIETIKKGEPKKSSKFQPKFKKSCPVSTVPYVMAPNFQSKAQPLDVQCLRDEKQPRKKKLYSHNSNHFLN